MGYVLFEGYCSNLVSCKLKYSPNRFQSVFLDISKICSLRWQCLIHKTYEIKQTQNGQSCSVGLECMIKGHMSVQGRHLVSVLYTKYILLGWNYGVSWTQK